VFLKSLTLKGFKSFADATTLEFEPGVTVVVGPNGSGKSNIVDAVAWVLGAQGPRTMRSARMDDVIFAGSAQRPALGRAEVSLTIDNSAGLLPIEFTELTVTRTLFRSGDSEYAINGAPCRLLDIQELLSDAGVGRQQHVIVSQGQLATVLDARPEDRRLLVEEAAGVLKYRRRRERAQRRLDATEANLVRLTDLVAEVRRQLRPLERQADAARRHGSVVAELGALRLHLAGRDLVALDESVAASAAAKAERATAVEGARRRLAGCDATVAEAEAAATPGGLDHLADELGRLEGLRERARGLAALLVERRRSLDAEARAVVDEGVVASLEADAARWAAELDAAEAEAAALVPQADELAAAEAALAADRAALGPMPGPGAAGERRAAELRGELAAAARAVEGSRRALIDLDGRTGGLAAAAETSAAAAADHAAAHGRARNEAAEATSGLAAARAVREAADAALAGCDAAVAAAERESSEWRARGEALALALEEALAPDRPGPGGASLGDAAGVVGVLRDLVEVDDGWDLAFEAAAGEALGALVVDGAEAARAALVRLRDGTGGRGGAVLALGVAPAPGSLALDAAAAAGADPVRAHVRADRHPGVAQLLDGLLAHAVAVRGGWREALDLALAGPGLVVVTMAGDRFAGNWWRAGAPAAVATRAALAEAGRMADAATGALAAAQDRQAAARTERDEALAEEARWRRRLAAAESSLAAVAEARRRADDEAAARAAERDAVAGRVAELRQRLAREEQALADLAAELPRAEAGEALEAERAAAAREVGARLDERAAAVGALRGELALRAAGLEERRDVVARRLAEVEERLRGHAEQRRRAAARREGLDARATATARLAIAVAGALAATEGRLADVRRARHERQAALRAAVGHLEAVRRQRAEAEAALASAQEQAQRAELAGAELRLRLEATADAVRRELGCEPDLARAAPCPEVAGGAAPAERAAQLERQLRAMGPVNPLAVEEHAALVERQQFVEAQLEDVRASRRELAKVIKAVDAELVSVFSAAFADVAANFERLFATLFPGGTGRLRLSDPDDLLVTGIEVDARPAGKNVRSLSLLSGGERSLAALAFLFAVFRSRPSPFYLLDEVEAALDDVNLHRFLELLAEFRQEAQLLVVTHQKRTMEIADCLYGVTMQAGGPSRVLSERISSPA
jgi:chromosome segregation protein